MGLSGSHRLGGDAALYEAKRAGRNRVVVHGFEVDPVASTLRR